MLGIFDSGIGGLIIAKSIMEKLPQYQIVYLGDTARLPYGNRSQKLIYQFTEQAVNFLHASYNCPLTIVACNTASAEALRNLQQNWLPKHNPQKRVLGVIRPMAEAAAIITKGKVGIIGTTGTIKSNAYIRELETQAKLLNKKIKIFQQAAPLLVPLIEEGHKNRPETKKILRHYLKPLKEVRVDTLILGCTHYPILLKKIKNIMGSQCKILSPDAVIPDSLKDYLSRHPEIESQLTKGDNHKFLVTDLTEKFTQNANNWLGQGIKLEKINIEIS